ncbi:probable low-specificity L-threonine aldolase 2, partial [Argonauta hians]
ITSSHSEQLSFVKLRVIFLFFSDIPAVPVIMESTFVDLRSDTVTVPTRGMRDAMANAEVGDDVLREDPTVIALEQKCANLLGKESALFVPTGTMANLLSNMSHCEERGLEIIIGDQSHIANYEQGNIAQIAGIFSRVVPNESDGTLDLATLERVISSGADYHACKTKVICLENTHNRCGGKILPLDYLKKVHTLAQSKGLKVHMDGARLLNASVGLGVDVTEITKYCDSVTLCFSKGIGAPVGSVVAGTESFIKRVLWSRKALGGGMRQVGILAAGAIYGLDRAQQTIEKDHLHARKLAEGLKTICSSVVTVDPEDVQTNIVFIRIKRDQPFVAELVKRIKMTTDAEVAELGKEIRVACSQMGSNIRLVTNCNLTLQHIEDAIRKILYVFSEVNL